MSQGIEIDRKTLDEWIANFRNYANLPFSTNYGAFSQEQLGEFIKDAANTYGEEPTAFRIYPVRYSISASGPIPDTMELEPGSSLSRPAFVFVPVTPKGEIMVNKNGKLYVLAFGYSDVSVSGTARTATAGFPSSGPNLCPPKC